LTSFPVERLAVIHRSLGQKQVLETTKGRRIGEGKWYDIE